MQRRTKSRANRQAAVPPYDSDRFRGSDEETKYDDVWCYKPVVVERIWQVNQFHGEEFMLSQNFEGRGWLGITHFQGQCVPDVVREFFANIRENSINKRKGRELINSWVRGVEIQLTPNDFAQLFQLPRVQHPEFVYPAEGSPPLNVIAREILVGNQEWVGEFRKPVSALTAKYWALHMFSCTNLLPQNRNADCSLARARLIYAIGTGMTLDLPSYIWHQIAYSAEHEGGQSGLPFGGALTAIFRCKGTQIPADLPIAPQLQPLTVMSYAKSRGNVERKKKKRLSGASMGEGSGSTRPWDEEDETGVTITDLVERMNQLEHNQEVDHSILVQMQQEQHTQTHLLQNIFAYMRDSHPPPSQ